MKQTVLNVFRAAFIATLLAGPSLMLSSCGDETEGKASINDAAPAKVTDVSSVAGPGEVYLTWTVPSDPSFMYTKITYKNAKGEEVYQVFSKDHADENGVVKATISGFVATDPVDFSFYACSLRGNNQGAVTYAGTPGAPAFIAVSESITAESAWGGIYVGYKNETVAKVFVEVKYTDKSDASKSGTYKFEAAPNSESKTFVHLFTSDKEFINGSTASLSITAQDADGNSSDIRSMEAYAKKVVALDRSAWTFPGFTQSNDPQIGYSSQEAVGENGGKNGRVIEMIDGNEGSFWHTSWKTPSAYPHFFIIDMGEDVDVSNVSIRRRSGNNGTHTGQTFYTCSEANASGADPNEWSWDNQGWYAFDRNVDRHQLFGMKEVRKARYIKAYFAETDKGGDFVMVSEFNAYTPAE